MWCCVEAFTMSILYWLALKAQLDSRQGPGSMIDNFFLARGLTCTYMPTENAMPLGRYLLMADTYNTIASFWKQARLSPEVCCLIVQPQSPYITICTSHLHSLQDRQHHGPTSFKLLSHDAPTLLSNLLVWNSSKAARRGKAAPKPAPAMQNGKTLWGKWPPLTLQNSALPHLHELVTALHHSRHQNYYFQAQAALIIP